MSEATHLDFEGITLALPEQAARSDVLRRLGRHCSMEFLLDCDGRGSHLRIDHGHFEAIPGPRRMRAWQFAVRATEDSWRRFWEPLPAVGYNDIFAMVRYGHATIEGDVGPMLTHLRLVKAILALPRGLIGGPA